MFKYLVVDEDGGITGLDNDEMARAIAESELVIDVQASRTIDTQGRTESKISSWDERFPHATITEPWNDTAEESEELPSDTSSDGGTEDDKTSRE